jgi:phospholipase C
MALADINHIVVLMQENRSFDHMLGHLRLNGSRFDIDGLTGGESNTLSGAPQSLPIARLASTRFNFSPDHRHEPVLRQIANGAMTGFADSFHEHHPDADPQQIMGFYDAEQASAFDQLAAGFTVCNRWFASHPGPTFPNRFCAVTGRTPIVDNFDVEDPILGYVELETIFDFLENEVKVPWRYFEHDVGFLRMFDKFRFNDNRVVNFHDDRDGFAALIERQKLPQVSFIDPNFTDLPPLTEANDDLAPADIRAGQHLAATIYNLLISDRSIWRRTLFVITYDEHGGFFDHVPPPGTIGFAKRFPQLIGVPPLSAGGDVAPVFLPDGQKPHPEAKRFMGVRVPALVVSPWVPERSASNVIFDHTSIMRTIFERFNNGNVPDRFGPRVTEANHLGSLLSLGEPRLDVPPIDQKSVGLPSTRSAATTSSETDDYRLIMSRFAFPLRPK